MVDREGKDDTPRRTEHIVSSIIRLNPHLSIRRTYSNIFMLMNITKVFIVRKRIIRKLLIEILRWVFNEEDAYKFNANAVNMNNCRTSTIGTQFLWLNCVRTTIPGKVIVRRNSSDVVLR